MSRDDAPPPCDGDEPGQEAGVRFALPSGVEVEFVTVADADYHHPTRTVGDPGPGPIAPRDLDHVNLTSHRTDEDRQFLVEHCDFRASDVTVDDEDRTFQAWLRYGGFHHDAGLTRTDDADLTLHHLAFRAESFEHIKELCDQLARHGHGLELGPSRHNAGSNLFAYFRAPGGNRIELSAEMATLDPGAGTGVRVLDEEENTVSSWGGVVPTQSFLEGGS